MAEGRCITSPNWPSNYPNGHFCRVTGVPQLPMDVKWFDIPTPYTYGGSYTPDYVSVGGVKYTGWYSEDGVGWPHGAVAYGGTLEFTSDGAEIAASGFKICFPSTDSVPAFDPILPEPYTKQGADGYPDSYMTDSQCGQADAPDMRTCSTTGESLEMGQGGPGAVRWPSGTFISNIVTVNDPTGPYTILTDDALFGVRLNETVTAKVVRAVPNNCAESWFARDWYSEYAGKWTTGGKGFIQNAQELAGNIVLCSQSEDANVAFATMAMNIAYAVPTAKAILIESRETGPAGSVRTGFVPEAMTDSTGVCTGGLLTKRMWNGEAASGFGVKPHPDVRKAGCQIPVIGMDRLEGAAVLAAPSVTITPASQSTGVVKSSFTVSFSAQTRAIIAQTPGASSLLDFEGVYVPSPVRCAKTQWLPEDAYADNQHNHVTPGTLWGLRSAGAQAADDWNPGCTYNKKSDMSATRIKYVKQEDLSDVAGAKHWLAYRLLNKRALGMAGGAWIFAKSISEELPSCQYCHCEEVCTYGPFGGVSCNPYGMCYGYLDNGRYIPGNLPQLPKNILEWPQSGRVAAESLVQLDWDGRNSLFPASNGFWTSDVSAGYVVNITVDITGAARRLETQRLPHRRLRGPQHVGVGGPAGTEEEVGGDG